MDGDREELEDLLHEGAYRLIHGNQSETRTCIDDKASGTGIELEYLLHVDVWQLENACIHRRSNQLKSAYIPTTYALTENPT
eukprot:624772-Rhodomonas_salina.1